MKNNTLGLYLHIPFCVRKCAYCDFLSFPADEDVRRAYARALVREIRTAAQKRRDRQVDTIFIGGGTPTCLPADCLDTIMTAVTDAFDVLPGAEVTMEMNPGTDSEGLDRFIFRFINRLSLGLQSMKNEELKDLGRIHSREDFLKTFAHMRRLGVENINVDLMSALPGQSAADWEETLRLTAELQPEHISAYSLIVEEGTPFFTRYENGSLDLPDEDTERAMYRTTASLLAEAGYQRYEISNYAKPGFESRHNSRYWTGEDYLGLGLGASSLCDDTRWRNTTSLETYLDTSMHPESLMRDARVLTVRDRMEEFMFLGLRLTKGVSLEEFAERFGTSLRDIYGSLPDDMIAKGLMAEAEGRLFLTERGIDVSNRVMAEFLL